MNQLNDKLAVIRRQKKVYVKHLENVNTIDERNRLKEKISILSEEERKIVGMLIE